MFDCFASSLEACVLILIEVNYCVCTEMVNLTERIQKSITCMKCASHVLTSSLAEYSKNNRFGSFMSNCSTD